MLSSWFFKVLISDGLRLNWNYLCALLTHNQTHSPTGDCKLTQPPSSHSLSLSFVNAFAAV